MLVVLPTTGSSSLFSLSAFHFPLAPPFSFHTDVKAIQ